MTPSSQPQNPSNEPYSNQSTFTSTSPEASEIMPESTQQVAGQSASLGKRKRSSRKTQSFAVPKIFPCNQCESSFAYFAGFEQHISIHNAVKSICPMGLPCEYQSATLGGWASHFHEAHRQYMLLSKTTAMKLARKTPCGVLAAQKAREALRTQQSAAASITQLPKRIGTKESFTDELIASLAQSVYLPACPEGSPNPIRHAPWTKDSAILMS